MRVRTIVTAASALALGVLFVSDNTASARQLPADTAPTFAKDVAPILYKECVSCHRAGEIGPMPLVTYADVRPWARSIKDKVAKRVMPPWFGEGPHGTFSNDRRLGDAAIETIVKWVDAGAPHGNPADLPNLPALVDGWQIGTPDAVFDIGRDFDIPATGVVDYQTFNVPTNFTEDRWVVAAEVRIGDRARVHHAVVTIIAPGGNQPVAALEVEPLPQEGQPLPTNLTPQERERRRKALGQSASAAHRLVGYAVGEQPPVFPKGLAKRVPAGATLSFSMHYTPNGSPGRDRTKVGIIFAEEPPTNEIYVGLVNHPFLEIPPLQPNVKVESVGTFTDDVKIWAFHPHMHTRGKDMLYTAIYPDGRRQVVMNVPRYDFNWQLDYYLADPLSLPKGTQLLVTAHFDNSVTNASNPNPNVTVHYGDQTWDEMMAGYFTYSVDSRARSTTTRQR